MLFKNKLIINNNLFYDNYNNYINLYDDMVGKNNNYDKNIFRFIHNYNTMFYILYKSSLLISKKYLKQSVNIKKYNLINFFSFNNINNIIKYKFNY